MKKFGLSWFCGPCYENREVPKRTTKPQTKIRVKPDPKAQADNLFSLIVRKPGRCEICGSRENLECAHGFSRRYLATRWDTRNAFCLCRDCHFHYTNNPILWDEWLQKKLGKEYDVVRQTAISGHVPDLKDTMLRLRRLHVEEFSEVRARG